MTELIEPVNLPNWMPLVGLANRNELDGFINVKKLYGLTNEKELSSIFELGVYLYPDSRS